MRVFKWLGKKSESQEEPEQSGPTSAEKRRHYRVFLKIPAEIHLAPRQSQHAEVADVSASGARIFTSKKLALKKKVQLDIFASGGRSGEKASLASYVARERPSHDKDTFSYGLTFMDVTNKEQQAMQELLHAHYGIVFEKPSEKRRHYRITCNIPVTYAAPEEEPREGIIQNVSLSGIRISTKEELSRYSEFELTFSLVPEEPMTLKAFVVRSQKLKSVSAYAVGLSYRGLKDEQEEDLKEGLSFQMRRRKGR